MMDNILQLIKNKPQENHFFKKLATVSNPFPMLKPLADDGWFDGAKNPEPQEVPDQEGFFTIPYWNVLGYLENVAKQNSKEPDEEITEILLGIIESVAGYRKPESVERVDNYHTDVAIVRIVMHLPIHKITERHIDFIGTALNSRWQSLIPSEIGGTVLPKLITNRSKKFLLRLLGIILSYKKSTGRTLDKYTSVMEKYWLKEALKKHKPKIAELCGVEAAEVGISKILSIVNEDESEFGYIPTIEDHEQVWFPDKYECQLVHFVRDMLRVSQPSLIRDTVRKILREKHPILKRIGLNAITHHYKELNDLFWDWQKNPLEEKQCKLEIYNLLEANCSEFSKQQIKQLLEWIESKKYPSSDEWKDNTEEWSAYWKKEWLSACLKLECSAIHLQYDKYHKISPDIAEHPGWPSWHEEWVGDRSPIEQNEFAGMSNQEIIKFLNEYIFEDGWKKPTQSGLQSSFQQFVAEEPRRFANDMCSFLNLQTSYQLSLLCGIRDAWNKEKDFEWDGTLSFITKIIKSGNFWGKVYGKDEYNYRRAIIIAIADLIEDGTRKDSHAFDANLLPQTEKILLDLANKTESEKPEDKETIGNVINSAKYYVFSAILNYSLRYARLNGKGKEVKWPVAIKNDFDKRLDKQAEPSLYYSTTIGMYLANLIYLDKKWVTKNINKIFPKRYKTHWKAAFTGYLRCTTGLYKNVYFLLRKKGHYAKALKMDFEDKSATEHIVQHICLGYLRDWEKLDDPKSLISKLLEKASNEDLYEVVHYLWMQRDTQADILKVKILPLWEKLFKIFSEDENEKIYGTTIRDLYLWLTLIDEIDDNVLKWIKFTIKHIKATHDVWFMVEYLLKHVTKTPGKVGEIYLDMLDRNFYPDYKKDDILRLIYELQNRDEKVALRIRNAYLAKGYEFVRS